ncbi:hypothetical protein OD917_15935 [Flavobacterium sp. SH_e]|uniref:hypothetical protein n=1 Tax=Flavobacterium sp. SH_e TaxID=2983767 RepID=UPI0021E3AB9F|nr:hypothetical protein [Flavobacterium sp. SH_e]MCV2486425.1 hypothetical protein [Flavobacterium sp. SH_e]
MWVTNNSTRNKKATKLEKFFIERIIQRCDYDETISKKHRTINGYTQLQELIRLAELSKKRIRTLRTLISIIKESKSEHIKQNIVNDIVIDKYFNDLKKYLQSINEDEVFKNDSLDKIDIFLHNLKKHSLQLEKYYHSNIILELNSIDFNEKVKIERYLGKLSDLVDLIIPSLLHKGYSISSLNEVLRRWIEAQVHVNLQKFLDFFNHSYDYYEIIIYLGNRASEIAEFKKVIYDKGIADIRKASEFSKDFFPEKYFTEREELIYFSCYTKDPVSFVRNQYDQLLKDIVIYRDRKSLSLFSNFFKNSYWRKSGSSHKYFKNVIINSDPISVVSRKSTLFISLVNNKYIVFNNETSLDFLDNEQLKKSVYYYNLALGSKSIENSLSLLWTAIECILPYRIYKADIENVRNLFSKTFSFGSYTRDIQYLIKRITIVNNVNKGCFNALGVSALPKNNIGGDLIEWIDWLKTDSIKKFKTFNEVSVLLAYEYSQTIKPLVEGNLETILKRMNASKKSIGYQLQRIYLHRNQIVHSGDYINEYTNLWIHLEWYVGKFLYHIITQTEITNKFDSIEKLFIDLESNYEYCCSYIEKNKNKPCKDSNKITALLFSVDWQ